MAAMITIMENEKLYNGDHDLKSNAWNKTIDEKFRSWQPWWKTKRLFEKVSAFIKCKSLSVIKQKK